jgi:hypothetical protein
MPLCTLQGTDIETVTDKDTAALSFQFGHAQCRDAVQSSPSSVDQHCYWCHRPCWACLCTAETGTRHSQHNASCASQMTCSDCVFFLAPASWTHQHTSNAAQSILTPHKHTLNHRACRPKREILQGASYFQGVIPVCIMGRFLVERLLAPIASPKAARQAYLLFAASTQA